MSKKDWNEIEEWDELDDDETEDNQEYSIEDDPGYAQEVNHSAVPANENKTPWGTIFWIAVVLIGGYFLFFDNDDSSQVQSTKVIATPSPITRYTPPYSSPNLTLPKYTIPYSPPRYFGSYPCTQDCSGHEAGYEWAEDKDIDDVDDCGGNSQSFIEGCQEYVEENYPEEAEDY